METIRKIIEAPLGRGGDLRKFDLALDRKTGEPDARHTTQAGLAAWEWHKRMVAGKPPETLNACRGLVQQGLPEKQEASQEVAPDSGAFR